MSGFKSIIVEKLRNGSFRNATVSGGLVLVNPIVQIIATPIIFKGLGATEYGVWALINTFLAASGVATLGLGDATTKYVAVYRAKGDESGAINVIRNTLLLYGVLAFILGLGLFFAAPAISRLFISKDPIEIFKGVSWIRIAAICIVLRFVYGVFDAALRGVHRYDIEAFWAFLSAIATTFVSVVFVKMGIGLNGVIFASMGALVVTGVGMVVSLRKILGGWNFMVPHFNLQIAKEVFGFGLFSWLQAVNGMLLFQMDRFLVGAWLGPAVLGYYVVCLQLVQTAHTVLTRASAFIFPLAVKFRESGSSDEMIALFRRGMILTTTLGWCASGALLIGGKEFLTLWMGSAFAESAYPTLYMLSWWNACLATTVIPYYIMNGWGLEKMNAWFGFANSILFVALAWYLIPKYGAVGAGMAKLISISTSLFSRRIMFITIFQENRWFAGAIPLIPFVPAGMILLLSSSGHQAYYMGILLFLISAGLCCLTSIITYAKFPGKNKLCEL